MSSGRRDERGLLTSSSENSAGLSVSELSFTSTPQPFELRTRLQSPAMFMLDAVGQIISASASAESFWLMDAAQLSGRVFVDLFRFEVGSAPDAARHSLQWELFLATALNRTIACA